MSAPSDRPPDPYHRDRPLRIRPLCPTDTHALSQLAPLEEAADRCFEPFFGPQPFGTDPAPSGASRLAEPGGLLVATDPVGPAADRARVLGFAHLLTREGEVHLEQLAVRPEQQGRGIGRALVDAAAHWARTQGYTRITLRTFAEIPFNAPLYRRLGFEEVDRGEGESPLLQELIAAEHTAGLTALGPRVTMALSLSR